jgi:hypothetical protein
MAVARAGLVSFKKEVQYPTPSLSLKAQEHLESLKKS